MTATKTDIRKNEAMAERLRSKAKEVLREARGRADDYARQARIYDQRAAKAKSELNGDIDAIS